MAAYASHEVGVFFDNAWAVAGQKPFGADVDAVYQMLAAGNREVFEDIAWQIEAYHAGGFAEIHAHQDDIPDTAYRGWMLIEKGLNEKDSDGSSKAIFEGNTLLFQHEQLEVLQVVLDKDRELAKKIGLLFATQKNAVGFPGSKFDPNAYGDFGDPKMRWEWDKDGFMAGWILWQIKEPGKATDFIKKVVEEGKQVK